MIPVNDRALLLRDKRDENIAGTELQKTEDAKEPYMKGTIMCLGPGDPAYPTPPSLKTGMKVFYYHQHAVSIVITIDGVATEYDQVRTSDIWMIL